MADGRSTDGRFAPGNQLAKGGSQSRGQLLAPLLRKRLNQIYDEATGQTVAERIVEVVSDLALEGTRWAVEWIGDRIDGKPAQVVHNLHDAASGGFRVFRLGDEPEPDDGP